MVYRQKPTGKAWSMSTGLAFGAMISVCVMLLLAAALAKLIASGILEEGWIGYGVMILLLVSSFSGAISSYRKIKRQRLIVCLMSGILYMAILLAVTALFFGGQYETVGVTIFLILGGCLSAGFIGIREKRGGKRGKIRL